MKPWVLLIIAILFEVTGTTSMKLSQGFTKLWPSVSIFVCYGLSFVALTYCLKVIDVSVAYAVWSGLGTMIVAVIGVLYFAESITLLKALSLLLIIIGLVGLNLSSH